MQEVLKIFIQLTCFRKWLTSKISVKYFSSNNVYCYTFKSLECEVCKEIIPEVVEYRGKFISILDFKDIEPPYIILQTINKYYKQQNLLNFTSIFVVSFKSKNNFIIGRANDADIPLNYPSISRNHCMLSYSQGNFYIDDLGSKFGTLLLIQNNILFLPFREITIQIGKFILIFKLIITFL